MSLLITGIFIDSSLPVMHVNEFKEGDGMEWSVSTFYW
jgi:hypothetical protein